MSDKFYCPNCGGELSLQWDKENARPMIIGHSPRPETPPAQTDQELIEKSLSGGSANGEEKNGKEAAGKEAGPDRSRENAVDSDI